jgi:hypothetical protein
MFAGNASYLAQDCGVKNACMMAHIGIGRVGRFQAA